MKHAITVNKATGSVPASAMKFGQFAVVRDGVHSGFVVFRGIDRLITLDTGHHWSAPEHQQIPVEILPAGSTLTITVKG